MHVCEIIVSANIDVLCILLFALFSSARPLNRIEELFRCGPGHAAAQENSSTQVVYQDGPVETPLAPCHVQCRGVDGVDDL